MTAPRFELTSQRQKVSGLPTVQRGWSGKKKEWTGCVQSDIRAFGIKGGWKATALEAEVWVDTVTKGGRRFMAAWRK